MASAERHGADKALTQEKQTPPPSPIHAEEKNAQATRRATTERPLDKPAEVAQKRPRKQTVEDNHSREQPLSRLRKQQDIADHTRSSGGGRYYPDLDPAAPNRSRTSVKSNTDPEPNAGVRSEYSTTFFKSTRVVTLLTKWVLLSTAILCAYTHSNTPPLTYPHVYHTASYSLTRSTPTLLQLTYPLTTPTPSSPPTHNRSQARPPHRPPKLRILPPPRRPPDPNTPSPPPTDHTHIHTEVSKNEGTYHTYVSTHKNQKNTRILRTDLPPKAASLRSALLCTAPSPHDAPRRSELPHTAPNPHNAPRNVPHQDKTAHPTWTPQHPKSRRPPATKKHPRNNPLTTTHPPPTKTAPPHTKHHNAYSQLQRTHLQPKQTHTLPLPTNCHTLD